MPVRVSEAFVLRTYPFQEGDLIASFFTRDQGKLRGVAKRARKPKSPFGSGLERLSQVRATYYQRETVELVRLESVELIQTQFGLLGSYEAGVALDYFAEVSDQLLPSSEPNERFFRLIAAVLAHLRQARAEAVPTTEVWRAVCYFAFWAVRLSGILPELDISRDSRALANEIASRPIGETEGVWSKQSSAELRRFLNREIEYHIERRLITVPIMEAL